MCIYGADFRTDCGSTVYTNEMVREGLQRQHPANKEIAGIDFGAVSTRFVFLATSQICTDQWICSIEQSVKDDLNWLKSAPLMRKELVDNAKGFVYDIKSGKLHQV
jgi:carbonic anhydrase